MVAIDSLHTWGASADGGEAHSEWEVGAMSSVHRGLCPGGRGGGASPGLKVWGHENFLSTPVACPGLGGPRAHCVCPRESLLGQQAGQLLPRGASHTGVRPGPRRALGGQHVLLVKIKTRP